MRLIDEFYEFANDHLVLSVATLGLAVIVGILGSRIVKPVRSAIFPGAQTVDAAARNALQSASETRDASTTPISLPQMPTLNRAKIRFIGPLTKFEHELNEWVNDPNVTGKKETAAQRILDAYTHESRFLNISACDLTSIPSLIGQLTALTGLNSSKNQLSVLPAEIGELTSLRGLNMSYNQLSFLPPEIGQLTSLTILEAPFNRLSDLPCEIGQLTALLRLNIGYNQLSRLSPEIGQLTNLEILNCSKNQLSVLPTEIGQLIALRGLGVDGNQLLVLPQEIGQLTALVGLGVSENQLSALPREIGRLTALIELGVFNNQLLALPTQIGQLTVLKTLTIEHNQLRVLPSEIGNLTALEELDLHDNQLKALPREIGNLPVLRGLDLSDNQLEALPSTIGSLTALTALYISSNQLPALPPVIGQLRALTNLWIFDNPDLRELPISLGDIPGITDLVIRGTRISSSIAASILGSCQAKRSRHNADMLPSRLNLWKRISGNEFDLRPILDLEDVDKVNVSEWLLRLSHTSDFGSGAQKELAEKACAMLIAVRDYPEFKDFFLGQIDANNRDCEDRAAQAFNELYVAYRIFTMNQDDPLINKLKLIQGCAKTLQLREAIRERIQAHENAGNAEVSEDVEIYLYYETKLRRELGLVTAVQSMRFERIGMRNWINEDELKRNVLENHLNLMSGMEVLRKIAFKDADLEARKRAVDEDFAGRLDALSAKELLGLEFKEQVDEIQAGQEQAITKILVAWVEKELAKG